jgi:hypothetical protein
MGWGSILEAFTVKQGFPGMRYRHLIQEERYQISALHDAGLTVQAIAAQLNRHASAISRELRRNLVAGPYQAGSASSEAAIALHFMYYNFCRIHKTLRVTPAMESGIAISPWTVADLVALLPEPEAKKRGSYKPRISK